MLLEQTLPVLLMHGIRAIIISPTDKVYLDLMGRFPDPLFEDSSPDPLRIYRTLSLPADQLAERARDVSPGPGINLNLTFEVADKKKLSEEHECLLRRAFFDMKSIYLRPISGGKSGAGVYQVDAKRADGHSVPLPYLVKFDDVKYAKAEFQAYHNFVVGRIPFNQRPNFDTTRCLFGWNSGVLVGDFVEGSVPLSEVVPRPEGRNVIYSLFDDAMRSWRRQSYERGALVTENLLDRLPLNIRPAKIQSSIVQAAYKRGCRSNPLVLVQRLRLQSDHEFRIGMAHGDLHAGNVMVRLGEAILIDFSHAKDSCALFSDIASLEVGLTFTSAAETVQRGMLKLRRKENKDWTAEVGELFQLKHMGNVAPILLRETSFSWLRDRVRQLRAMALLCGATDRAYACAIAAYLIRRARLGGNSGESIPIAGMALATAERLIIELEGR